MRKIILSLFVVLSVVSCAKPEIKPYIKRAPVFTSEIKDPYVIAILNEYKRLAALKGIKFTNNVTIGFSDEKRDKVIGVCFYGDGFREIELSREYWNRATFLGKVALELHELNHCYCDRDHDYGKDKFYPDDSIKSFLDWLIKKPQQLLRNNDGYFEDTCPLSIMQPVMLSDSCFFKHYVHYINEMFDRCYAY